MVTSERASVLVSPGTFTNLLLIRAFTTLLNRSSFVSVDLTCTFRVFAADCSCPLEMSPEWSSLNVVKTITFAEARGRPIGKG